MFASDAPMPLILRFDCDSINNKRTDGLQKIPAEKRCGRTAGVSYRAYRHFGNKTTPEAVRNQNAIFLLKALALIIVFSSATPSALAQKQNETEIARVKSAFAGKSLNQINVALAAIRPEPVSRSDKSQLMCDLPLVTAKNRVKDHRQLDELRSRLAPTLKFYARYGVVDLILVQDPRPIVYSKPGVVVVISTEVMKIVGDDDAALVGIIAHELAHEYVAQQMLRALQSGDLTRMRELELFCDAVAVVVLLDLGLDATRYGGVLRRIATHSQASAKLNNGFSTHPAIDSRLKVISDISALFNSQTPVAWLCGR